MSSGILTELRGLSLLRFVHSSFQYIFGAYSIVRSILEGTLEKGLQDPIMALLLHRPLLSHFAIWFTKDGFQQSIENRRRAYSKITTLIMDKIDIIDLDLSRICELYPMLNIYLAENNRDDLTLNLFSDALRMCKNIESVALSLSKDGILGNIARTLQPILTNITVVQISEDESTIFPNETTISTQGPIVIERGEHDLRPLISSFVSINRRPELYILSSQFEGRHSYCTYKDRRNHTYNSK